MSVGTASNVSSNVRNDSHSTGQLMDQSIYVYRIPENERITICYYLDQNNAWEVAAQEMGYGISDLVKIKKMAQDNRISPAEQLLSFWGDQNHTVTELFMVLNRIEQFSAMECLKDHVDKKYHRLLNKLPNFQMLLGKQSFAESKNKLDQTSEKILNGPEMSRDSNETETDESSIETSSVFNVDKLKTVSSAIPQIPYHELQEATNNWNEANKLGSGGFGIVYKGRWKYTDVAIKKIVYRGNSNDSKKKTEIQIRQSINELRFLNSCRHDHVLPLYGFCIDDSGQCLVYQYMAGGSLETRIHINSSSQHSPLTFFQRTRIALGTARGLQYLHTFDKKPLIHGDIKPANILLDPCCMPKIGDFGLVREGSNESMEVSSVYGTRPYLPMEFLANRTLSTRIDTYSYGIVLFELFTGLKAYDKRRGTNKEFLSKYMHFMCQDKQTVLQLMDKNLDPNEVCTDSYLQLIRIALACANEKSEIRPEMVEVLKYLDKFIDDH